MRCTLGSIAAAVFSGILAGWPLLWRYEDAHWYYEMASGNPVRRPFAERQLDPLLARLLHLSGLSLLHGFEAIGLFSFVAFAASLFWILNSHGAGVKTMALVALTSFWAIAFGGFMLPDTLNNLLLLIFVLLLMRSQYMAAMVMLLPLALSRETVVLIAIAVGVAAWGKLRLRHMTIGALSLIAGLVSVKFLSAHSPGNVDHLNEFAYLALKGPFNFTYNALGIEPWANTLPHTCSVPRWSIPAHIGGISAIGICGFSVYLPLYTLATLFCEFGLFLFLLPQVAQKKAAWIRFCALYGLACFVLAPVAGSALDRLTAYSWPLFFIAVPLCAEETISRLPWAAIIASGVASWLYCLIEVRGPRLGLLLPAILALAAATPLLAPLATSTARSATLRLYIRLGTQRLR